MKEKKAVVTADEKDDDNDEDVSEGHQGSQGLISTDFWEPPPALSLFPSLERTPSLFPTPQTRRKGRALGPQQ